MVICFFVKEPKRKYVGFHQDAPIGNLSSSKVVTAWIALSDSVIENGCLQFIESSNKDREAVHPLDIEDAFSTYKTGTKTTNADDLISYKQLIPEKALQKRHYVELNSGEYSLHDISVIHGSSKINLRNIDWVLR